MNAAKLLCDYACIFVLAILSANHDSLAAGGDCLIPAFEVIQTFQTPEPMAIATTDFDGNGLDDLALIPDSTHGLVYIYLNHADNGFALTQLLPMTGVPAGVVAGDWSGDGSVDLIVWPSRSTAAIQFVVNNGNGAFALKETMTVAESVWNVAIADIDGDGARDVIGTMFMSQSPGSSRLLWLKGDGAGGFNQSSIKVSFQRQDHVEPADLDGDGDVDLIVTRGASDFPVVVELNNGTGVFSPGQVFSGLGVRKSNTLADVNGDDRPDIVFHGYSSKAALVYLNNGDATFSYATDLPVPTSSLKAVVGGDLNNDGSDDLVGQWAHNVSLYASNNGGFDSHIQLFQFGGISLAIGTFDNTQGLDLLSSRDGDTQVLSNRGLNVDCNMNGISDPCEIAGAFQIDCNRNTAIDECEIANNSKFDCNNDSVLDACQSDCNRNQIHDSCDLVGGTLTDFDGNGVPDACESLDCNGNGQPDIVETATGATADCNNNLVPDECEISMNGFGLDDGKPDEIWSRSGPGWAIFGVLLDAGDGLTIDGVSMPFTDAGDGDIAIGDPMRVFVWEDPNDDGLPDDAVELRMQDVTVHTITPQLDYETPVFNNWEVEPANVIGKFFVGVAMPNNAPDGYREILLADRRGEYDHGHFAVFGGDTEAFRNATFYMQGIQLLLRARSTDCDQNTIPDRCDINAGDLTDVNHDGVADECDCFADVSGDANVNVTDLNQLLAGWTCTGDCAADFNGDGRVNVHDLFLLLAVWGACP